MPARARVAGHDVLTQPVAVRRAIGVVGQKHGSDPEATGRENLVLQGELYGISDVKAPRRRDARALRARRRRRPPGQDLLRRHGAPARRRARADPPPAGAVPRRADDRAGPGGARGAVGRDRAARARGADDDPAHHPLPRGGRPARLAARDRRPRADRRPRHAGRAEGRTAGRHGAGRADRARRRGRDGARAARAERGAARGQDAARPHRQRRGGDPGRARGARGARRARRVGDARAPVAR